MIEQLTAYISAHYDIDITPELSRPDAAFGDIATNVALQLAGRLKRNPRQIAEELAEVLRSNPDFAEVTVAGPGFINVRLSDEALLQQLQVSAPQQYADTNVVIETNSPNPFKAMHIGHAMNAVVPDAIANILERAGAQVHRVSYHGDVGLHVGKSMYSLLKYAQGDVQRIAQIPKAERNSFMSRMYAEGAAAYKESEEAKREIDALAAQSFTCEDPLYKQIYELCLEWSYQQIDETVARLGNKPIERRFVESAADSRGVAIVKQHTPAVFTQSNGAYIFEGSKYGSFDNVFVSSNGRGLYAARDLGLMELKNEAFHPDKSIIVTGGEQGQYFKGVIAAAELSDPSLKGQTVNIPTGLVKLTTGKMSSRDGNVITIDWIFDQFRQAIEARGAVATDATIAGALRYQFLKVKIGSDVIFDINDAVSITGNTGSYLQYAHARAKSILRKIDHAEIKQLQPEDRILVRKMGEYSDVVDLATRQLEPHHICQYLFELAQEFNRYYERNRVVGSELQVHRAGLVAAYAQILADGLALLGIHAPDEL
ncbi:arginine--tRNA ligase [Candidatus Saccharibacteria bacterium]|nr:arginine--tRNA ligase [Candidatus Saccharibacteria bacterium]